MKKILYSLLIFISIFFISRFDVKALSINVDYSGFNQTFRFIGDGISDVYSCFEKTCSVGTNVESISFETYLSSVSLNSDYDYTLIYTFDINDLSTSSDNLSSANVWTLGTNVINNVNTSYSYMPATKQVVLTYNFSVSETGTYNMFATIGHDKDPSLYSKIFYNETNTSQTVSLDSVQFFYDAPYNPPPIPSSEDVVYFDTKSSDFIFTYNAIKDKLEEILNVLKNNNPNNYRWAVYIGEDSSGSFVSVNLLPSNFSSNPTSSDYAFCYITASKYSNVYYNAGGCNTNNVATKRYTFRNNSSIATLNTDLTLAFNNISGKTTGSNTIQHSYLNQFNFSNHIYDYFTNNNYFILPYASSVPIYNYNRSSSSTFYHIKIGDNELAFNSNSLLEPSDKYIDIKDYYEFNEEIDDINYSKMIFDFDVSVLKERENVFDYLIQFETIGSIQDDNTLDEDHLQKFSRPYVEYVDSSGITQKYDIDFGYDDQDSPRNFWWTGNQDEITGDITSLRLIIPMHETAYARYSIQLTSFIPSTVSYVTNEESLLYYETIDLSNKYGVVFMPKLVENDSDISSVFYTDAIEEILVYSSYDYKKPPIEVYDSKIEEFSYIITYEQQDYNLFFKVNSQVANLAIVTYDTRYYTYQIVDSKYSMGTLVNPNNGNSNHVDYSNTDNLQMNFENMSDIFTFVVDYFDKNSDAYILFSDSLDVFFNTMPSYIYMAILTLLLIILIGVSLALGGWK